MKKCSKSTQIFFKRRDLLLLYKRNVFSEQQPFTSNKIRLFSTKYCNVILKIFYNEVIPQFLIFLKNDYFEKFFVKLFICVPQCANKRHSCCRSDNNINAFRIKKFCLRSEVAQKIFSIQKDEHFLSIMRFVK